MIIKKDENTTTKWIKNKNETMLIEINVNSEIKIKI